MPLWLYESNVGLLCHFRLADLKYSSEIEFEPATASFFSQKTFSPASWLLEKEVLFVCWNEGRFGDSLRILSHRTETNQGQTTFNEGTANDSFVDTSLACSLLHPLTQANFFSEVSPIFGKYVTTPSFFYWG